MANKPAPNKRPYNIWIDRDLLARWLAAHDRIRNPGSRHVVRLIEEELRKMEGEGGKNAQTPPAAR